MDIKGFTAHFAGCLNHTDAATIGPDTEFKKLDEWSSIFALIVIAMVDSEYNKVLTSEDIRNSKTLSDLYHLIQSA